MTRQCRVSCPYCGEAARLVTGRELYPHRPDLRSKRFWMCGPCEAWVGCHENSPRHAPLGRLANAELRALKSRVHAAFDPLWQRRLMTRRQAYRWLADALGIALNECHVGMFDPERCRRALELLEVKHKALGLAP